MNAAGKNGVFAVVLAAGSASRYGQTKQLEVVNDTTLVRRVAERAREVCGEKTVLVTGHDGAAVARAAGEAAHFLVVNDRYAEGMGSSIAVATRAVAHVADGLLLLLVDQPLITVSHLRALRDSWSGAADEIVATSFADTVGPPVLFPSDAFPALAELSGDHGARRVLQDTQFDVKTVAFEDAAIDIDTLTDLAIFEERQRHVPRRK